VLTHGWSIVRKIAVASMTTMGGFDVICDRFDVDRLFVNGKFFRKVYLFIWWVFFAVALLVAHAVLYSGQWRLSHRIISTEES
jgi:hypothetical protein